MTPSTRKTRRRGEKYVLEEGRRKRRQERRCRRKKEKKKKIVFRVHGNADCGRRKTYGSICLANDPISHEN